MGFNDCDSQAKSVRYITLKDDGDGIDLLIVDEPMPRTSDFRGQKRKEFLFPVIDESGLALWSVGVTMYRYLRDNWDKICRRPFRLVRVGKAGDTATVYNLAPTSNGKTLLEKSSTRNPNDVEDMLRAALQSPDDEATSATIPF